VIKKFKTLGVNKMVITRLDVTYRLGSIIASAHTTGLPLSQICFSPHIAEGLVQLNARILAKLLLTHPDFDIHNLELK
jgi:flagellar biosynthesis protein FlhF